MTDSNCPFEGALVAACRRPFIAIGIELTQSLCRAGQLEKKENGCRKFDGKENESDSGVLDIFAEMQGFEHFSVPAWHQLSSSPTRPHLSVDITPRKP
jgi:hypothetical protein